MSISSGNNVLCTHMVSHKRPSLVGIRDFSKTGTLLNVSDDVEPEWRALLKPPLVAVA